MKNEYQIVVQWDADSMTDFDLLISIEDFLTEKLSSSHKVDGHDMGSGEMNIFIHTFSPQLAFEEIKSALETHDYWLTAKVGYRDIEENDFSALWPRDLINFDVK